MSEAMSNECCQAIQARLDVRSYEQGLMSEAMSKA